MIAAPNLRNGYQILVDIFLRDQFHDDFCSFPRRTVFVPCTTWRKRTRLKWNRSQSDQSDQGTFDLFLKISDAQIKEKTCLFRKWKDCCLCRQNCFLATACWLMMKQLLGFWLLANHRRCRHKSWWLKWKNFFLHTSARSVTRSNTEHGYTDG